MDISRVWKTFVEMELAESQAEFSVRWLGKGQSYLSCLRARKRQPSVDALLALATRSTRAITLLRQVGRYEDAALVDKISGDVWGEIFERSILPAVDAAENSL